MPTTKNADGIYRILLLTNRDSDNCGDQVIEECAKALLETALENLGVDTYRIISKPASIVPSKYTQTRDSALLAKARKHIAKVDLVVFGGAPLFNFRYQVFYERTATTLEIAQEYGTPVLFSSIGVEGYEEDNPKCQRLSETLALPCVKQITTRDDFDSLKRFVPDGRIPIQKVSDPAVFSKEVFAPFIKPRAGKRVGIFVMRANAFLDNGICFSPEQAAHLWLSLAEGLKRQGYDYEFLTSGHFGDEAFLDRLIKDYGAPSSHCVFNMNSPEALVERISTYDAIVSCRLHPSIVAYSLGVPALGIVWNSKVNFFYDAIGYPERIVLTDTINAEDLVHQTIAAARSGVDEDPSYLDSVYQSLFKGLQDIITPAETRSPYSHQELIDHIPTFAGTTEAEREEKIKRKLRRAYGKYNEACDKNRKLTEELKKAKQASPGRSLAKRCRNRLSRRKNSAGE